jgi:hypothetical protein
MKDFDELAQRYIDTWNETDPASRRRLVEATWSADGGSFVIMKSRLGHPSRRARGRDVRLVP